MTDAVICAKPVNELLKESFFVPSYQRGFRWTQRQVEDLLNDLSEFQSKSENMDRTAFYCLQPIVVKKRPDGGWELVDGQQRLTTIFLILTHLKTFLEPLRKSRFKLTFETRGETSGTFLQDLDRSKRNDNIDYYYVCNAYDAIERWFGGRDGNYQLSLLRCLLNDNDAGKNVKVIWYEIPERSDAVEAFVRLNVGKIPLTNAELIRALFLRSVNFDSGSVTLWQLKIAQEWDGIEKMLQSDEVWYFLCAGSENHPSRIEYIFQLIAKEEALQTPLSDDVYHTFHFYNARLSDKQSKTELEWLKVKQYFMALEEWFSDRVLYHLVGYLIHDGDDLLAIRKAGKNDKKSAFRRTLKRRIFQRLIGTSYPANDALEELQTLLESKIEDLEYGQHSSKIRSFLLLFNIATLLQNHASNLRFPFDSFDKENWDIEHIRSAVSGKPQRVDEKRRWLENAREYLLESADDELLFHRIDTTLVAHELDGIQFDSLYDDLLEHFQEATETEVANGIGNLTLLDAATNRSYKNAVFPVKRRRILGLDRAGTFVPLCTKNTFLKCYSRKIGNMMFWSTEDSESYRKAITETLVRFFHEEEGESL